MSILFQRVHRLDTQAFLWIHGTQKRAYWKSIRWLSRSGDGPLYLIMGLLIWALDAERGATFAGVCAFAFGLEVSLYWLLKNIIKRDRPAVALDSYQAWIIPSDQFSFPSGHTAAAFVFAGLIAAFYPAFAPLFYLWACLIGLSRVLLGVHYPSDIAAGALLGSACSLVGVTLISGLVYA